MNKEDLLKKRYKFIAPYPYSFLPVGVILTQELPEHFSNIIDGTNRTCVIKDIEKYPHLFELLPWYAERDVNDLPEYIKYSGNNGVFQHRGLNGVGRIWLLFQPHEAVPVKLEYCLPTTLEEYNNYLQSKIK